MRIEIETGTATLTCDAVIMQLILRSACADMSAMAMSRGSDSYRTAYGLLLDQVKRASPWTLDGKIIEMADLLALLQGNGRPAAKIRYWCHPESAEVFTTDDGADMTGITDNGFVEEIDEATFLELREMYASQPAAVSHDDLDDLLG